MPTIAGQYVSPADCMLRCPCCRRLRDIDEYQTFLRQINELPPQTNAAHHTGKLLGHYYWHTARHEPGTMQWACDECLATGRAATADTHRQLFCDFPPHFAYYDQEKTCRDCGRAFVFSSGEQRHWYEQLGFWVPTTRVRCTACTQRKNERDRLSQLLSTPDYTDLNNTQEVLQLLLGLGDYERAKYHLTQSRKAFVPGSPESQRLSAWRAAIKAQEQAANDSPATT